MISIKFKLLFSFLIIILFLTINSIYIVFLNKKLSQTALSTTDTKDLTEETILSANDINKTLILYSVEQDETQLSALLFEINSAFEKLEENYTVLDGEEIFKQYSIKHRNILDELVQIKNRIVSLKEKEIEETTNFDTLLNALKKSRHQFIDGEYKVSDNLHYLILESGYFEKEYLFQYQDKEYELLWLKNIEKIGLELEKENLSDIIPALKSYQNDAINIIMETYVLQDIESNKSFQLALAQKNNFEINLASDNISKIAQNELNLVLSDIQKQRNNSLILIFSSFFLGLLVALKVSRNITQSLKELTTGAEIITNGNLNYKVQIKSKDEIGYLGSMFNKMIESIKHSKNELQSEHEQLKSIISSIGDGLIVIDDDNKIILTNKITEDLLKIRATALLGKNIHDVVSILKNDEELPLKKWLVEKVFKDKKSLKYNINDNLSLKTKQKKILPIEISINPLYTNEIKGAVIVFRDISNLKIIEEERQFSKHNLENVLQSVYIERDNVQDEINKLQEILSSIGDAVLAVDNNQKTIIFNPVAEQITGFKFKDMENKSYDKFIHFIDEESKKVKTDLIDKALMGKAQASSNNLAIFTKKKNLILVDINASPIKNKKEGVMGCIVVFRDVTEKRETERMRSDFISTVSHQLRTPLSAMKWFIEILLNEDTGKLKPKQTDIINEIQSSNQNMINFVNQMLSVSRIENDNLAINPEVVNLNSLINILIKELESVAKKKNQKLKFINLTDKSLEINIDKNLLRNIIDNLIVNALRYTPENGKIILSIKRKGKDYLLFEVKDNGIGIPKKEQPKLFKKFSRGSNAIKYEASGTGLGLYIIKSILNLIGGKIWFKSEENKGTTFFFTLPIDSMFCKIGEKCTKK